VSQRRCTHNLCGSRHGEHSGRQTWRLHCRHRRRRRPTPGATPPVPPTLRLRTLRPRTLRQPLGGSSGISGRTILGGSAAPPIPTSFRTRTFRLGTRIEPPGATQGRQLLYYCRRSPCCGQAAPSFLRRMLLDRCREQLGISRSSSLYQLVFRIRFVRAYPFLRWKSLVRARVDFVLSPTKSRGNQ
jgi:hypothetical protein